MIPAAYRLPINTKDQFRGRPHRFTWGSLIVAPSPSPRWLVTISKKAAPLAAHRNRLRRQINYHYYSSRHRLLPHQAFRIIISKPPATFQQIIQQTCSYLYTDS